MKYDNQNNKAECQPCKLRKQQLYSEGFYMSQQPPMMGGQPMTPPAGTAPMPPMMGGQPMTPPTQAPMPPMMGGQPMTPPTPAPQPPRRGPMAPPTPTPQPPRRGPMAPPPTPTPQPPRRGPMAPPPTPTPQPPRRGPMAPPTPTPQPPRGGPMVPPPTPAPRPPRGRQPMTAPPNFTPEMPRRRGRPEERPERGRYGPPFVPPIYIQPRDLRECLNRFTYIWLINGNSFWFYPTYIYRDEIEGFRWRRGGWEYDTIRIRRIDDFRCF